MDYVFFAVALPSIYDIIFPLIEEKKKSGNIVIVATTDQIEQFFREFTNFKVIRVKVHPDLINRKSKYRLLFDIIKSKLEYRKLFKHYSNAEIYFCGDSYALVIFSYLKKLSRNNKVIRCFPKPEKTTVEFPIEHSFRAYIMRWIAKWLMGVETEIRHKTGIPFWQLNKKFYDNIQIIDNYKGNKKSLEKYMLKLDILKGKEVLVAIEDSVNAGTVEKEEFISKMDEMIDILDELYPKKYVIKPHPRLNRLYGKMATGKDVIPPYVLSEFLMQNDWKVVIGLDSSTLIKATEETNSLVISLIDAIDYIDANIKNMYRDWLAQQSQKSIMIPSNMKEFKKLLEKSIK